jgi:hypothetical protein
VSPAEGRTLREVIATVIEPIGDLHWDQRLLADLAGVWDLDLTSADCEDGRQVMREALMAFGEQVAAALVLRPSEDWQPIATAPKDDKMVLWLYDANTRNHYVGWWYAGGGFNADRVASPMKHESIGWSRRSFGRRIGNCPTIQRCCRLRLGRRTDEDP